MAFVYRGDLRRGRKPPPGPEAQAVPSPPRPSPRDRSPQVTAPHCPAPPPLQPGSSPRRARRPTALQPSPRPADPPIPPRSPSGRCPQPGMQGPERSPATPPPRSPPGLTEIDVSEGATADLAAQPVSVPDPQLHGGAPVAAACPAASWVCAPGGGAASAATAGPVRLRPPHGPAFTIAFRPPNRPQRLNTGRMRQSERRRRCSGPCRPRLPSPRCGWTRIFRA